MNTANKLHLTTEVTSRYKFSGIKWLKNDYTNAVLNAAVDWQRFQSMENTHALYMAVLAMTGQEPENIHLLDGEN